MGVNNKITEEELVDVYNLFDMYIQYSNSEGFGMPQLEAAQCGIPVVSVNYSAMQSVIKNIEAYPIEPLAFYTECETGCRRAIPNGEEALNIITKLYRHSAEKLKDIGLRMREKTLNHYSWDKTAKVWEDYFVNTPVRSHSETWLSPPRKFIPAPEVPDGMSVKDQTNFLFDKVMGKPEWIGGYLWKRTLKDLIYKCSIGSSGEHYFNESHTETDIQQSSPFNIDVAYKYFFNLRTMHNEWEDIRVRELTRRRNPPARGFVEQSGLHKRC